MYLQNLFTWLSKLCWVHTNYYALLYCAATKDHSSQELDEQDEDFESTPLSDHLLTNNTHCAATKDPPSKGLDEVDEDIKSTQLSIGYQLTSNIHSAATKDPSSKELDELDEEFENTSGHHYC